MISVDSREELGKELLSEDLNGRSIFDGVELPVLLLHEVLVDDEAHARFVVVGHREGVDVPLLDLEDLD